MAARTALVGSATLPTSPARGCPGPAVLVALSENWETIERRIAAKTKTVRDVDRQRRLFRACSRLNSSIVAAPGCGWFSDRASDELRNREGSRPALPSRHSGLARSVDPDLLLPRPAAIRSHKERSIRLPGGGKECKDAGCARFAVNGCPAALRLPALSILWPALSSGPPEAHRS